MYANEKDQDTGVGVRKNLVSFHVMRMVKVKRNILNNKLFSIVLFYIYGIL